MKLALVYDRVNKFGGAERILESLHEIWPKAPLYTSVYNRKTAPWAKIFPRIISSFLQHIPFAKTHHELYPYLMPLAFETIDFSDYDVVISVTSESAKNIITKPHTLHISYILTPTRYLWSGYNDYVKNPGFGILDILIKIGFPFAAYKLRQMDFVSSYRPDTNMAISHNIQKRITKYYKRNADVIYPPVDTSFFVPPKNSAKGEYFLIVSRLVSYKHIDVAVKAFNTLKYPLVIIGSGSEERRLKRLSTENIRFVSGLTDRELLGYYQRCIALIFTSDEDLGLTPIEAQSCGKPVVAFHAGGALETVVSGKTGEFYKEQNAKSLKQAVEECMLKTYSMQDCRNNALQFSKEKFKSNFKSYVLSAYKEYAV